MYTTDHIFPVLPIKRLVNQDSEPARTHKISTGSRTSVSNLNVLLCLCVVLKATEYVDTKALNMCHKSLKGFIIIFVGIPQHQKGYLIYISSTRKTVSSNIVIFDKSFSNMLAYTSHTYLEAFAMQPEV